MEIGLADRRAEILLHVEQRREGGDGSFSRQIDPERTRAQHGERPLGKRSHGAKLQALARLCKSQSCRALLGSALTEK